MIFYSSDEKRKKLAATKDSSYRHMGKGKDRTQLSEAVKQQRCRWGMEGEICFPPKCPGGFTGYY